MRNQSQKPSKPRARIAFAVVAAALLGAAALYVFPLDDEASDQPSQSFGGATDPVADVAGFAAASGSVDDALAAVQAASLASGAGLVGNGSMAINGSVAGAMPTILDDGDPVEVWLLQAIAAGWGTASFDGGLPADGAISAGWGVTAGVTGQASSAPTTGNATLDGALVELQGALAEVEALWGSPEIQAVWAELDKTPVGTPGLARDPFGAAGVLEPDEEVAVAAQGHAEGAVQTVAGGYGALDAGLSQMLATQRSLASDARSALEATQAYETEAIAGLQVELAARIAALEDAAAAYEEAVAQAAAAYAADVQAAADDVVAQAEAQAQGAAEAAAAAAADVRAEMEGHVDAVRADAEARLAALASHEATFMADAQAKAEAGADVAADVEAYAAAAAAARSEIDAQVAAVEDAAAQAIADAEAQATAHAQAARSAAAEAAAAAQAEADGAIADAQARADGLRATVEASLGAAVEHQTRLQAQAEAGVRTVAEAHSARIRQEAQALVTQADSSAMQALELVDRVQSDAAAEVGKDLTTIQDVAEDYAGAPTPEREAKAAYWQEVHATLSGALATTLADGEAVADIALELMVAAEASAEALASL